jgi:hypothetical protein
VTDVLLKPLHVGMASGQPLRFFRTPINDGRPDLHWHAVDDLHRCLGLNREQRRFFQRKLQEWGDIQTVATADGIITVAPHYMAQGVIDAMIEQGMAPTTIRSEYDLAGIEATKKVVPAYLDFPGDAWLAWMKAAMNRWEAAS